MKVSIDGQVYEYDSTRLLYSEARFVQEKTGLRVQQWQEGLGEMDALAVGALVYILKQRAGENPDWDALDFNMASLEFVSEDMADAGPKEDAPAASPTGTS